MPPCSGPIARAASKPVASSKRPRSFVLLLVGCGLILKQVTLGSRLSLLLGGIDFVIDRPALVIEQLPAADVLIEDDMDTIEPSTADHAAFSAADRPRRYRSRCHCRPSSAGRSRKVCAASRQVWLGLARQMKPATSRPSRTFRERARRSPGTSNTGDPNGPLGPVR